MKVRGALVLACLVGVMATGCVPLKPYEDVKEKLGQAKDINLAADRKLRQADQELVELRERIKQLESRGTGGTASADEIRILEEQLAKEREKSRILEAQLKEGLISTPFEIEGEGFEIDPTRPDRLILPSDVTFASGSAELRSAAKSVLDQVAGQIKSKYSDKLIHIYGYTDRQKVVKTKATNRNNWFLGCRRANGVFEYLVAKGIPEDHFAVHSLGYREEREKGVTKSEKNRRVELAVSERTE